MNKETTCIIKEDGTVNIISQDNGVIKNKIVPMSSFTSALTQDEESVTLPLLPTGLKKYIQRGNYTVLAIEYPPTVISNFNYKGDIYSIPAPRSVWISLVSKIVGTDTYKIHKTWPFALDMPLVSETQQLYKWPFTNWSISFGDICWGSDRNAAAIRKSCTISNVSSLYSVYFNAVANDHLGWDANFNYGEDRNPARFLNGKENFDVSWFQREQYDLEGAIEQIFGNR